MSKRIKHNPGYWLRQIKAIRRRRRAFNTSAFWEENKELRGYIRPPEFFGSEYMLEKAEQADWQGCHMDIVEFAHYFVRACRKVGIPMYVHTAYRDPVVQVRLYRKGLSEIIAAGPHQRGAAVDIVSATNHWNVSQDFCDFVGELGKQTAKRLSTKIIWGGDFTSLYDPMHWQLADWRSEPPVFPSKPVHIPQFSKRMLNFGRISDAV
jgi:hypothetical protein